MVPKCDVGLKVTSHRLSLLDLAARLERDPQSGSHDNGSPRGSPRSGLVWDCTIWRENARDEDATLEVKCKQLLFDMPPKCIELRESYPEDISVYLSIAIFYTGAYASVTLPRCLIREISNKDIDLDITCYPCCEPDEEINRGRFGSSDGPPHKSD